MERASSVLDEITSETVQKDEDGIRQKKKK